MKDDKLLYYDYIKDKNDYDLQLIEDPEELAYREYDIYCDEMVAKKNAMLDKTIEAHMCHFVKSTNEKPIVATSALDTCYGILFYDRERKEAFCGHAAPGQLVSLLSEMLEVLGNENRVIEYMFLPGFRNVDRKDYRGIEELRNYLYSNKPSNVKITPLKVKGIDGINLDDRTLSYEFAFDAVSGEFVTSTLFFDVTLHNPRYIAPKKRF